MKITDGSTFVTVAGLRARRLSFNAETIDITVYSTSTATAALCEAIGDATADARL